jgi:UPF0755 protein
MFSSPPGTSQRGASVVAVLLGIVVLVAFAGVVAWAWVNRPLDLAQPTAEVSIEPGTPVREIVRLWRDAGVRSSPDALYQWFRWSGQSRRIRAGSYAIDRATTPRALLEMMVRGDETLEHVRFNEGWTVAQMRAALAAAPALKATTAGLGEDAFMQAIGAPGERAEGRFFPDTYAYSRNVSDVTVLRRAHAAMARQLHAAWQLRTPDSPLKTPDELLTLASVVEKETGNPADRGRVASVFANRLRIGMPLQSDPTVIYALGAAYDGNLRKVDLQTDRPYNTYTRAGLPPTPIALPGRDALRAAAHPDATKALYFVSRGDGTSVFSDSLAAHNAAVNLYQKAPHR